MGEKAKRQVPITPVILKFGVALAFSLGGVLYTFFASKRIKPSKPKPSNSSPGNSSQSDSRRESVELGDEDRDLQNLSLKKVPSHNSINDLSSSGEHSRDRDGFLVPELNHFLKEHNAAVVTDDISPKKNGQSLPPEVESPNEHNREITSLRTKVEILEERERMLEIQLLEYYGLKEQETACMELQNRLRLNNMEAKIYSLKIESLHSDNRRLEAQVADHAKVVAELEAAKAKIKVLRKKLRSDAEHNKEQILSLQERVMKLRDEEINKNVEINRDLGVKEVEEELEEMKSLNDSLKRENSELARKLEYVQRLATSALDNEEMQELKEESQLLRQQNEDLKKEIEQLQADRCTDIEELVYLRWINACLRYEMRNHQPAPGKTIARDLSKSLSPKSEEKAKQLILEYANKEDSRDKTVNISDLDSDQWSITDSGEHEPDDLHNDNLSAHKINHSTRKKVFSKLMKLVRGKDNHHHHHSIPTLSVDDIASRYQSHSFDLHRCYSQGQKSSNTGESSNSSRRASDDDGSSSIFRTVSEPHQESQNAAKIELVKYAEALKNSRVKPPVRRRAASFSSF